MSTVAEFAARLHRAHPSTLQRTHIPAIYQGRVEKLYDIRAIIFDVYGTLVDYWQPHFADPTIKEAALLKACDATINHFGLEPFFETMNSDDTPAKTLFDLYHGLIAFSHDKARVKGIEYPEVIIEEIWMLIILMLRRHGFDPASLHYGTERDLAKCLAYYYNSKALGRGFFPSVVPALDALKAQNFRLGIVSNAQFYTPIDLSLFVRDQAPEAYEDYLELIEPDLAIFSYVEGTAKPGQKLFRKLYDALYEYDILPEQTVFVGNDLLLDIAAAREAGMKTALFCGDQESLFAHDLAHVEIPDIVFSDFADLPSKISFYQPERS